MKARPILFSGPMIRALLDGRKMQTRRIVKLQTGDTFDEHALVAAIQEWRPVFDKVAGRNVAKRAALIRCPFGQPGDLLWVREAFSYAIVDPQGRRLFDSPPLYRVDDDWRRGPRWKPSIHMPRVASRLTLEITGVRVERLQDISEADAMAEGVTSSHSSDTLTDAFHDLWGSINGPGSWGDNPWVWALTFTVHRCNVDELLTARAA